jgi:dynactin complex subunit
VSLEEKIDSLIEALNRNTAAHSGKGGAAAADKTADKATDKTADKATGTTKIKPEEVKALLMKVKEEKGTAAAKKIIADAGAEDMANLLTLTKKFAAVVKACEAALEDGDDDSGDDDGL